MNEPMFRRDDTRRFAVPEPKPQPAGEATARPTLRLGWQNLVKARA